MGLRSVVHRPGEVIKAAYFPETGYTSLLASLEAGDSAEVGLIGFEGVVGVPLILGTDRSPIEGVVQSTGVALRLDADAFRRAMDDDPALRNLMLRYAMAFGFQVTMTAACNGRHQIDQRLARWLLMAHDRVAGDEFAMTHEFLSMMLGVRRAGVSVSAGLMQKAGYIRYEHGRITLLNRPGLEAAACECHAMVRRETERLMAPGRAVDRVT